MRQRNQSNDLGSFKHVAYWRKGDGSAYLILMIVRGLPVPPQGALVYVGKMSSREARRLISRQLSKHKIPAPASMASMEVPDRNEAKRVALVQARAFEGIVDREIKRTSGSNV